MIMFVILGLRLMLSHVLLNENFYHQLQQEVKLAKTISENVSTDLKTLMGANNLPESLVENLVPMTDIEEMMILQTKEIIEFVKGNQERMTILNPEPYIWELEPRIMTYLNDEGYKVEDSGYEDLAQINKSVYEITRGNIHLFDVSTLMYSGTVEAMSHFIQFIIGPLPLAIVIFILIIYLLIWKMSFRHLFYWGASAMVAAGLFGIVMIRQLPNGTVGISTNSGFNEAIRITMEQVGEKIQILSYFFIIIGFFYIFFYFLEINRKICKKILKM